MKHLTLVLTFINMETITTFFLGRAMRFADQFGCTFYFFVAYAAIVSSDLHFNTAVFHTAEV